MFAVLGKQIEQAKQPLLAKEEEEEKEDSCCEKVMSSIVKAWKNCTRGEDDDEFKK